MVSVVLPAFNSGNLLKSAVQSILDQRGIDFELIVVDDCSRDGSTLFLETVSDSRLHVIHLKENLGYPSAMRVGIERAQGKYIARMDADDLSEPTRLAEQVEALEKHPEASFCGLARYRITPGGKRYADKDNSREPYRWETWNDLLTNSRIFTDPSVMISKEKLLAVGGYRTFQQSGMDVDLWLRVMERFGPCITITKPLFGKRLEPGSLVFKPETPLINQVPRALALQRKKGGVDDIQAGKPVDIQAYLRDGLIKPVQPASAIALFVGAAATCVTFGDGYGFGIYLRKAWSATPGLLAKIRIVGQVFVKCLQRLRRNPYTRYSS